MDLRLVRLVYWLNLVVPSIQQAGPMGAALSYFGTGFSILFIVLVQMNDVLAPRLPWLYRSS